ncbi:MAG TPA: hypothetical protein VNM67_01875 [Thermoanaerobaculia bacterium]|nr:hypothetical protein [Thermoanaerobaculia bacterium]
MPRTKSVFFGPSPAKEFDKGESPCCAINSHNTVVEIHKGESSTSLNWRVGTVNEGIKVEFVPAPKQHDFDTGYDPAVALTDDNIVIEVHGSRRGKNGYLYHHVGTLGSSAVSFPTSAIQIGDENGFDPSIAVDGSGYVVEVHNSDSLVVGGLYYRLGRLDTALRKITWPQKGAPVTAPGDRTTSGNAPSVAMNRHRQVVVVYENEEKLYYLRGRMISYRTIQWSQPRPYLSQAATRGRSPSVALTDEGYVYEVHQFSTLLYQMVGRLDDSDEALINWQAWLDRDRYAYPFDSGQLVQIAANGKVAVQVHQTSSSVTNELYANASLSFDRANSMGDNHYRLQLRPLRYLVLPGSHDSGAYLGGTLADDLARTQSLTFYGQLASGVRYLDVRLTYRGSLDRPFDAGNLFTHHGPVKGASFMELVRDLHDFMQEHNELVIVKLSHYENFNQAIFDGMAALFKNGGNNPALALERWLFTGEVAPVRLADRPMGDYVKADRGTVLIVADSDGDHDQRNQPPDRNYLSGGRPFGVYGYRDWYATDPQNGDLTVFDVYSHVEDFADMSEGTGNDPDYELAVQRNGTRLPQGQLPKFRLFDGICRNQYNDNGVKKDWPCDLFLLSWTLTPATGALALSREANRNLVDFIPGETSLNQYGRRINVLYTDGVPDSRSVDVAALRNEIVI